MQVSHRSAPGKLSWPQDGQSISASPFLKFEVRMTKFEVPSSDDRWAHQSKFVLHASYSYFVTRTSPFALRYSTTQVSPLLRSFSRFPGPNRLMESCT